MPLNIVLFEPEIPNNTGNIGRLSLASGSHLHLVKPFGFEIDDKRLKRAGLDYWQHLNITYYNSISEFFQINADKKMAFLSSHGEKSHWDIDFEDDMFLIFGKESVGLPKQLLEDYKDSLFKIPLFSEHIRSLNLANAVSIVVYEGLKKLR
ncbi:tRNA (cytidine(34)-2'-O)-methyltransferase [Formosa algae]|uniref:Putative tRNA (cytidine(34)-2'-O)-methyltransferase n=1 Tax=Formosa algae TaxID=225843 RepID=A0A9X0YM11_9FLAO|nr:tRNA (cytidine(34)-2'-O)-methyltransferase [Formosa algae]MBP1839378.1 tRNA (cytidine/uridine-2'-O-)-methyltransferase [Formosa algae]MDQ0334682.1 tRNA (cytidine/uridine-2'-O-)-methyltransferase [Formosa algae]OEI81286.1 tRNA (uridine(34)/cytosine(34)/5-carboxymethylaminomethyluridine(34)-2'-O)-methyltransferase TrmL [Formosa algae]PNW27775.1 tRNA (uridine(34)/cytosine(34)/5-carboxymethylaminomethyluridine(34)-2'-O)-methyltransferase TrmL [Formosa algae]